MPRSSQSQKTLTILQHEARLRKYALLTFGAQGTQDLAVLGAILGNNIHEIGRYRVTCDGTTIHGKFSVYELVHFGVLFATGRRSSPRCRSNKRRRQNQQCPTSLCSEGGDDVATAAEGGEGEMEERSGLCVTAPRIYPAMLANLFPTIVFKTLRKKSVRPQKFQHDDGEDDDLAIVPPHGQGSSSQQSSIQSNNSLVQATPQKARSASISGPQMVMSTSLSLQSQLQDPSTQSSHLQDIKDQSNRESLQEQEKEQQHPYHLDFTSRARADDDNENAGADSDDATDVILRRESDCPCTPTPCLQQQQKLQPQQMQSQLQSSSLPQQQQQQKQQQYPHQQHQPMQGGDQSDPLLITSDVVLATLVQKHIHRVRDLPLPQELSFLGAVSLPLPSSLRAMHVAWTIDFLRTKTTTPRRLRQEQKRYPWSSGEDGGSALMPELYGGLEFRPEVYAYKMGLARVARFQDRQQQQQQQQQQRLDQDESPSKRRGLPADVIPEESEEDLERLEQEKEEEKDEDKEEKEEPMRSDQAISVASRIPTTTTPDTATSPILHSATGTTPSRLHPCLDSVNRDKRLVQQLLSLENKVPRAVRQWAKAARRCFAEDLLHEDGLVQEWVDRRRIQVVLHCTGSSSVGTSSMFLAGLSSHLNNGCTISTQGGGGAGCTDNSFNNKNIKSNGTGDGARRRRPPSLTLVSPHWVEQAQRCHSRLRGGGPPPLRTPTTSATITTASSTACAGGNDVSSSSQQVTDQDKGVTGALAGSAATTGPTCFAEGERVRTSRPISQQLYSQHYGGSSSPQQVHGCARRSRPSSALGYGGTWAQSPGLNHYSSNNSNNKGTHRISTSQQMLSMHLWLSLLVSPMSPERMVKDQFGFMDSLN